MRRPRHDGHVILNQPLFVFGGAGGDAAVPRRLNHLGQAEVIADGAESDLAFLLGVIIGGFDAGNAPVAAADGAHAARCHLLIHRIHELTHRHFRVITVHHVDIDVICPQPLDAGQKLFGQAHWITEWGVRTFVQNHHLFAHATVAHPLAQQLLAIATHVDKSSVEDIATLLHEVVEHDRGMRNRLLVVHTHHQPRHRLGHAGDLAILHLVRDARGWAQRAIGHGHFLLRRVGFL